MMSDDFEADMEMLDAVLAAREKHKRTLEILDTMNKEKDVADLSRVREIEEDIAYVKTISSTYTVPKVTIRSTPPSGQIFRKERACCLFTSDSLLLDKAALTNRSKKLCYDSDPDKLLSTLAYCVDIMTVQDPALSRYLFFLMSVYKDFRRVDTCLQYLTRPDCKFKPELSEIFSVFVNWGFDPGMLYPDPCFECFKVPQLLKVSRSSQRCTVEEHNMMSVFKYLNHWTGDVRDMKLLVRVLVLCCYDEMFCRNRFLYDCVHSLLAKPMWSMEDVVPLAEMLHFKELHFHFQAHVAWLVVTRGEFSNRLSSSLAYATVQQLLDEDTTVRYVQKVGLDEMKALNLDTVCKKTLYEIYMIVWLLNLLIGYLHKEEGYDSYVRELSLWLQSLNTVDCGVADPDRNTLTEFVLRMYSFLSSEFDDSDLLQLGQNEDW